MNPADAALSFNVSDALRDVANLTSYLKPDFDVSGSFDLKLNNLVLTPAIDLTGNGDSIFDDGAYIEIFIPDLKNLE